MALVDDAIPDPNTLANTIFSSCFAASNCGPSEFAIPVSRLGFNIQPSYKTIRARVIQQALDSNQNHESLPIFSFQNIGITAALMGLEALFIGQASVQLKCLRNETLGATLYVVTVMRVETQKEINTKQTVSIFVDGGYVITKLPLPDDTATQRVK